MNHESRIKRIFIAANWKCNPTTSAEAKRLFGSVKKVIKNIKNVEVVICPPFLYISNLKSQISNLRLGAQDVFWEEKGAFTGEISPAMLKDLGCEHVIIGHSERRKYFNETDEVINKKIKAAINAKLKPILCIGETENERKAGKTFEVLRMQLKKAFINSSTNQLISLIVAYEPIWAIGTGNHCLPETARETLLFLRKFLKNTRILYGGSANAANAASYIKEAGFDGLLVGGASLDSKEFIKLIKSAI